MNPDLFAENSSHVVKHKHLQELHTGWSCPPWHALRHLQWQTGHRLLTHVSTGNWHMWAQVTVTHLADRTQHNWDMVRQGKGLAHQCQHSDAVLAQLLICLIVGHETHQREELIVLSSCCILHSCDAPSDPLAHCENKHIMESTEVVKFSVDTHIKQYNLFRQINVRVPEQDQF